MKVRLRLRARSLEGIDGPFPVVKLLVHDRYGALAVLDFRVDTQADLITIPAQLARREGIPFSEEQQRMAIGLGGEPIPYRTRVGIAMSGPQTNWRLRF